MAKTALEHATASTVQFVRSINHAYGLRLGCKRKDGYSPEYILRKLYLCGLIEIRRRLTGQGGLSRWVDYVTARAGIQYIFKIMKSRGESIGISAKDIYSILQVTTVRSRFRCAERLGHH